VKHFLGYALMWSETRTIHSSHCLSSICELQPICVINIL